MEGLGGARSQRTNLNELKHLPQIPRVRSGWTSGNGDLPPDGSEMARFQPGPGTIIATFLLLPISLALAGCGHASLRCPTPTTELDRLRTETEQLREEIDRAAGEEDAWEARKDAAQQRLEEIQARSDSLAGAPSR